VSATVGLLLGANCLLILITFPQFCLHLNSVLKQMNTMFAYTRFKCLFSMVIKHVKVFGRFMVYGKTFRVLYKMNKSRV